MTACQAVSREAQPQPLAATVRRRPEHTHVI